MYPVPRLIYQMARSRTMPRLGLTETHVSHHICWPWDLDFWLELNNGRTLTLFDMGRIPLARRTGLIEVLRREGWGLTIAGSSVRYRRRVRAFHKLTMRSRAVTWDARFLYLEQAMFRPDGDCTSHALYRSAITDANGLVPPARVLRAMGQPETAPPMPDWIAAWSEAEAQRPWPPMQDTSEEVSTRAA